MIYFDTAFIAKCYLNEPGAAQVRALARVSENLCSCELARVEFFATVHRHLREEHIRRSHADEVLACFESDEKAGVWEWVEVTPDLMRTTCDVLRRLAPTVFVRAMDAVHLVCARTRGLSAVYTNDRHMIAAAPHFLIEAKSMT